MTTRTYTRVTTNERGTTHFDVIPLVLNIGIPEVPVYLVTFCEHGLGFGEQAIISAVSRHTKYLVLLLCTSESYYLYEYIPGTKQGTRYA